MIEYFRTLTTDRYLEHLESFEPASWVCVTDPMEQELELASKEFSLNIELLREGLDENELPRIDIEDSIVYIFIKAISAERVNTLETVLLVIGENFILSMSKIKPHFIQEVVKRGKGIDTEHPLSCVLEFLSFIDDEFEKTVLKLVKSVQKARKEARDLKEKDLESLLAQEDFLNNLISSYYYANLLYGRLMKRLKFTDEDKETLKTLVIESAQGLNSCRSALRNISNIRNYYSIVLSNKLNRTIRILTAFTIFVSIPAAVSGLYGMNVRLPYAIHSNIFWYVTATIVLIWIVILLVFRMKQIL